MLKVILTCIDRLDSAIKAVYNEVERMLHNFVEENIQKCKLIEELRINIYYKNNYFHNGTQRSEEVNGIWVNTNDRKKTHWKFILQFNFAQTCSFYRCISVDWNFGNSWMVSKNSKAKWSFNIIWSQIRIQNSFILNAKITLIQSISSIIKIYFYCFNFK